MKYLLPLCIIILLLTSCGPDIDIKGINIIYTINKGGKGTVEAYYNDITSKKDQSEITQLIDEVEKGEYDLFKEYGVINRKQTIQRDKKGILNGYAYGEFKDIFTFVKVLAGSEQHLLNKNIKEKIEWSKEILTIELEHSEMTSEDSDDDTLCSIIFKTEGRFLEGTTGLISKNRRTSTVTLKDFEKKIVLIIEGLSKK
jgi:hypothetical protein